MLHSVYFRSVPVVATGCGKSPRRATNCSILILSADQRMDLGDIAARKSHHGCIPISGFVGIDEDPYAGCFGRGEGIREVSDLIPGYLSSIWIRQMTIRDEHGHLSKFRLHADSAISISRTPDFDARRMCIIRYDFSVRERHKASNESFHRIRGHINTGFWDSLESRIGRRDRVPVELCVHPTRPLDHGISPDRIVEWTDEDIRARRVGSADGRIHVGHKITRPL